MLTIPSSIGTVAKLNQIPGDGADESASLVLDCTFLVGVCIGRVKNEFQMIFGKIRLTR
jgi:hypothetical protein